MNELNKRIITSIIILLILSLSLVNIKMLLALILFINYLSLDEFIKLITKINKNKKFLQCVNISCILIYMIYFSLIVISFSINDFELNKIKILFLLLICVSTDIGGYAFGKTLGGKKLTKISPNKTYSGMIGSFIFPIFFGLIFYNYQQDLIILNTNLIILIIITSFLSQIGDLIISAMKRKAKLKDTGSFLPGHGGVLDRIDGILLALPIGIIIIG